MAEAGTAFRGDKFEPCFTLRLESESMGDLGASTGMRIVPVPCVLAQRCGASALARRVALGAPSLILALLPLLRWLNLHLRPDGSLLGLLGYSRCLLLGQLL